MGSIRVMRIIARMNVGGPAVEIANLMRGLDPEVFDQRLVTGWCAEDEADFLETQALDVAKTRIRGFGRAVSPIDDSLVLPRLIKEINAYKPHIVHTHTTKAGVLGRIAARASAANPKIIHTYHGHLLNGYFSPGRTLGCVKNSGQSLGLIPSVDQAAAAALR